MELIYTGHVGVERRGDDLFLQCRKCKAEELVKDFEHRGRPQKFTWCPISFEGEEYAKCHSCGVVHKKIIPGAR